MNDLVQRFTGMGPVLWQQAAYGMVLQEVVNAVPGVVETDGTSGRLENGATALLGLDDYIVGNHAYVVHFYFLDQRLVQVTVATKGGPSDADFEHIIIALRGRYGPELSLEREGFFWTADWLSDAGTNINVTYGAGIDCLNINYQARLLQDVAKL